MLERQREKKQLPLKEEQKTEETANVEVTVQNGEAPTEDGKKIEIEDPEITIELAPGKTDKKTEKEDAWFNEDTFDVQEKASYTSVESKSEVTRLEWEASYYAF
uniref:hypothetical protein n=1 Tax=Ndongobacter massiliensis TaxID=1871025 RepID=UPI0009307866|nr:hypothetical protein [Ndongobacter massiliensis]